MDCHCKSRNRLQHCLPGYVVIMDLNQCRIANRYDVEIFQKIEELTGQKMEIFSTEQVRWAASGGVSIHMRMHMLQRALSLLS